MSEEKNLLTGKFSTLSFVDKTHVSRTGTILKIEEHGILFREHGYRKTAESKEFFIRNEDIVSVQQATEKDIAEVLAREAEGKRKPKRVVRAKQPPKPPRATGSENVKSVSDPDPLKEEEEENDFEVLDEEVLNNEEDFDDDDEWGD